MAGVPFALWVEYFLDLAVMVLALVLLLWALIHTATQRPDAFTSIGGLTKQAWLGILGVLFGLNLLLALLYGKPFTLFVYVGLGAAAYYLLETRRGLKDVAEGHW